MIDFTLDTTYIENMRPSPSPQNELDLTGTAGSKHTRSRPPSSPILDLKIGGMHCVNCAQNIERVLQTLPDIQIAQVNFATKSAHVEFKPGAIPASQPVAEAIQTLGYIPILESSEQTVDQPLLAKWQVALILLAIGLFLGDMILDLSQLSYRLPMGALVGIAVLVQAYFGASFYRNSWAALRHGLFTMDTLVAIGTSAAFLFSMASLPWMELWRNPQLWLLPFSTHHYFESAVLVICFVKLGQYLEQKATSRATASLQQLASLLGAYAWVEQNGKLQKAPVDLLRAGQIAVVKAGQRIPADGKIISGQSDIDESMFSGEVMPKLRKSGDRVKAGSINLSQTIKIEITHAGVDTRLGGLLQLVQKAANSKAPVMKKIDRICHYFVPATLAIAGATFILWAGYDLHEGRDLSRAIMNAVSVLVIACPCALGLATPTVVIALIHLAATKKLLIKNAAAFEWLDQVDYVVLDKTGTLTIGKPVISDIIALSKDKDNLLRLAASAAQHSHHPLSQAVVADAQKKSLSLMQPVQVQEIPGQGLIAKFLIAKHAQNPLDLPENAEIEIYAGSKRLLHANFFNLSPLDADAEELALDGKSLMFIGIHFLKTQTKQCLGVIAMQDQLRSGSQDLIHALKLRGLDIMLLTGDTKSSAMRVAQSLSIDDVQADIIPEEKAGRIQSLKNRGRKVVMLGDGINDSAALATAHVGIAIAGGSDVAMQAATVGFMGADPSQLLELFALSELFKRKIKENLIWAFGFNAIGIPIAALGYLHPAMAGLAMALSSIMVVSNAFAVKR